MSRLALPPSLTPPPAPRIRALSWRYSQRAGIIVQSNSAAISRADLFSHVYVSGITSLGLRCLPVRQRLPASDLIIRPSIRQQSLPNPTRRRLICLARTSGSAEPTQKLIVKHVGHVVRQLSVCDAVEDGTDFRSVLVCRCTGFKQPYRIRFIDGALNGCGEHVAPLVHRMLR